jgi:RHS repeat-associated protein
MPRNALAVIFFYFSCQVLLLAQSLPIDLIITERGAVTDLKAIRSITLQPKSATEPFVIPAGSSFRASIFPPHQYLQTDESNKNFIKVQQMLTTNASSINVNEKIVSYQYFDGLGRPIQAVDVKGSPTFNDVVQHYSYDVFGRENKKYLPYTSFPGDGLYKASADYDQLSFYYPSGAYKDGVKTGYAPWAETKFEPSPLNRPFQQGAEGSEWYPHDDLSISKAVKFEYPINVNGSLLQGQEVIPIWTVQSVTIGSLPEFIVSTSAEYQTGSFSIQLTTDGNKRQVRTYTDKSGKTIVKKVQYVEGTPNTFDDSHWAITYYVYDDFDQLRFVLQPEFWNNKSIYLSYTTHLEKRDMLNRLAFEYKYDSRNRMVFKKVPGADAIEMVYDNYDRLVLSRDGNQKLDGKWMFTKYDFFNRPIMTGLWTNSNDWATLQVYVDNYTANNSNRFESPASGNSIGYTTGATFPGGSGIALNDLLTITYYDNYSYQTNLSLGSAYGFINPTGFTALATTQVKGKVTGIKTRIVGSSNWLLSALYYDERYRMLQTVSDDHLGNKNRITNQYYGITDWVTKTKQDHGSSFTKLTEMEYDHRGRLINTYSTIGSDPRILLVANKYNEIGQLIEKNIHSTDNGISFLQSVDYRYNMRGWLTHINNSQLTKDGDVNNDSNDLFGMQLLYNEASETVGTTATIPQFNGNISAAKWSTNNLTDAVKEKLYQYTYDPMSRLQTSNYAVKSSGNWNLEVGNFNENLSYDKNGNILTLSRYGWFGGSKQQIDRLSYEYKNGNGKGNQLVTVTDDAAHYQFGKQNAGFVESTHVAGVVEMDYDKNGNLKYDLNKNITAIVYNHLNLPIAITVAGGKSIQNTYDAAGTKLKYKVIDNGNVLKEIDYVMGLQYEAGILAFAMTGEGRAIKKSTSWEYEYHLKDHLGNMRVAFGNLQDVEGYKATMEPENATVEEYEQNTATGLRNIQTRRDGTYNHTTANKDTPAPTKAAWLNGGLGREMGPAKGLTITSGDKLKMEVYARYNAGSGTTSDVVASLLGAVTASFNATIGENLTAYNGFNNSLAGFVNSIGFNSGQPKAYINYILFDANYANPQFGYKVLTINAATGWEKLDLEVTAPYNGFAYIYVSNESNYHVYFDDLAITHEKTTSSLKVVQAQDYYPFGLTFNNYQLENALANKYLFQEKEFLADIGLNLLDFDARLYDPAIGRTTTMDPMTDDYVELSPYSFLENNPLNMIDPTGMDGSKKTEPKDECPECEGQGQMLPEVVVTPTSNPASAWANFDQVTLSYQSEGFLKSNPSLGQRPYSFTQDELNAAADFYLNVAIGAVIPAEQALAWAGRGVWLLRLKWIARLRAANIARIVTTKGVTKLSPYELEITHGLTKSKNAFAKLKADMKLNGIQEPIKFVEHNGKRFVVDGHHRLRAAKELGIENVPVQQVKLPYAGYKSVDDLIYSNY